MKYYIYNIITWALSCLHIIKRGSVHYRTEPRPWRPNRLGDLWTDDMMTKFATTHGDALLAGEVFSPYDWRSIKSMSDLDIVYSRGDMPEVPKELFVVPTNETGIISIPDYALDLPVPPATNKLSPPPTRDWDWD